LTNVEKKLKNNFFFNVEALRQIVGEETQSYRNVAEPKMAYA